MSFPFRSLVPLLLGLALDARAAGGPSVRAMLLVPGGPNIELHSRVGDKVNGPIHVGARGLSQPFSPGARVFELGHPPKAPGIAFRPLASVRLPAEGDDFIALLEPAGKTYEVHIVMGNEPAFGADAMLFFNASDVTLGATLGEKKVLFKPRELVFSKAPSRKEKPWFQVTFYEPDKGGSRLFGNTRWPHRDHSRTYVFLYRSQPSGRLAYEAVDEVLEGS